MSDTEVKAPKIEFPNVDYPVKVISDTGVGNKDKIIDIVKKHATVNDDRVDERQSTNGKWMDGWESRRKRFEGYDSAVIQSRASLLPQGGAASRFARPATRSAPGARRHDHR